MLLSRPLNVLFSISFTTAAESLVTTSIQNCDESALDIHDLGLFPNLLYLQNADIDGSMKILYWKAGNRVT